jgi:hypothetical protein
MFVRIWSYCSRAISSFWRSELGLITLEIGLRLAHVGLALDQRRLRLLPLGRGAGDVGLRLPQRRLERALVDDEEQVARLDGRAVGHHLPLEEALDAGAHLDRLHGLGLTDVVAVHRDRALRSGDDRDGGWPGRGADLGRAIARREGRQDGDRDGQHPEQPRHCSSHTSCDDAVPLHASGIAGIPVPSVWPHDRGPHDDPSDTLRRPAGRRRASARRPVTRCVTGGGTCRGRRDAPR